MSNDCESLVPTLDGGQDNDIDEGDVDIENVDDKSVLEAEIILGKLALGVNSNAKEVKVNKYAVKRKQRKTETIGNGTTSEAITDPSGNGNTADNKAVQKQTSYSAAIIAAAQDIPEDKRPAFLSHVKKLAKTFEQEAKPAYKPRPLPKSPAEALEMGITPYKTFTDVLAYIKTELAEWLPNEKNGNQRALYRNDLGKFDPTALGAVKHQITKRRKVGESTADIETLIPTVNDRQETRIQEYNLEDMTVEDLKELMGACKSAIWRIENPTPEKKSLAL